MSMPDLKQKRAAIVSGAVKWGPWSYRPRHKMLVHADGYEVDFREMTTPGEVLDWIAQVSGKDGVYDAADVGHFIRALDALLSLQANVVREETFDAVSIIARTKI